MIIQRWQSLLLFVAVIFVAVFCFTPYAIVSTVAPEAVTDSATIVQIFPKDSTVLLIVNLLIAVLLFISIFMFRNLRKQMTMTMVSLVLIAASVATTALTLWHNYPEALVNWVSIGLLVVAFILVLLAYRCMRKDLRTLSSYDRLR